MDHNVDMPKTDAETQTSSLEKLLADAEQKLKRESAALEVKRRMVAALPKDLPLTPSLLSVGGYKCDAGMLFEMTDRAEAVALLEKLPPVESVMLKGACTSFFPKARLDGELKQGQRVTPVAGVQFNCDGYGSGYIREEFVWWTQLGDLLVQVKVRMSMTASGGVRIIEQHVRSPGGVVKKLSWKFDNAPTGLSIYWSRSDEKNPGPITVYRESREGLSELASFMLSSGYHTRG